MPNTALDPRLTNPEAIVVALYKPKKNAPGINTFDRGVTVSEFVEQVITTLKNIPVQVGKDMLNAYDAAENVFNCFEREMRQSEGHAASHLDTLLNDAVARIFAIAAPGRSEGDVVRLTYLKDDGTYVTLMHIKYLIGADTAWRIARLLTEALDRGR